MGTSVRLESMHRLDIVGPPHLTRPDGSPADLALGKPFAVLVFLALTDTPPTRKELARLFWPGSEARNARQSVRQTLSILRRGVAPDLFSSDDPVRLTPGLLQTDLDELRQAIEEGEVEAAETLWRGRLMQEFALPDAPEWTRWVEAREMALEAAMVQLLATDAEALRQRGEPDAAIARLQAAIGIDPYRERLHSDLLYLFLETGRTSKAAAAIGRARELLGSDSEAVEHMAARLDRRLRRTDEGGNGAANGHANGRVNGLDHDPSAELRTELVGRTREMSALLGSWRLAVRGAPAVVVLTGPAGIGKTRLTEELADLTEGESAAVVRVTAERGERNLEWGVIAELARKLSRLPGAEDVDPAAAATLRRLSPVIEVDAEEPAAELEPTPVADSVTSLLLRTAREQSVLVVVDEAQWVDACSRAVLSRLARSLDSARCALVVCLQDEETGQEERDFISALSRAEGSLRLDLKALSDSDVREMISLMVDLPEEKAHAFKGNLAAAASGNPLYLTEVLRALVKDGTLVAAPEGLSLAGERMPDSLPLPKTVRELLHHRLATLSDPAIAFAAHLARIGGKGRLEDVKERSQLSEGGLARAAGELLTSGVVEWSDPEIVAFSHDRLRRAVLDSYPVGANGDAHTGARRRTKGLVAVTAAAAMVLALFALQALTGPETDSPLYGGGLLAVYSRDAEIHVMDPRSGPPEQWSHEQPPFWYPRVLERTGPFRLASGDTVWYVRGYETDTPPSVIEVREDGTRTEILRMNGDVNLPWVASNGQFMTYVAQNTEVEQYHQDLWVSRTDGSEARRIMRYAGQIGNPQWSPNGKYIATQVSGESDTILALSPLGERLAEVPADRISRPAWCGATDTLVAIVQNGADRSFLVLDLGEGSIDRVPAPDALFSGVTCSPDGSALVHDIALDGRSTPALYDLGTGEVRVLPERRHLSYRRWIPDEGLVVPVAARMESDSIVVPWGESGVLGVAVVMSDSSLGSEQARWASSSPGVASVSPDGRVSANLPGTAWIKAIVQGWLVDSARVTVTEGYPSRLVLHDRFEVFDTTRWIPVGFPIPRAVDLDDGPALSLEGDGVYKDGAVSRETFDLGSGATLELNFRLRLTTDRQQRIGVGLFDGEPLPGSEPNFPAGWSRRVFMGFDYPAAEEMRFDPAEVNATFGIDEHNSIFLPDVLPTEDWVHAAFQVRPDGYLQLFVNHQLVATSALRVDLQPDQRFRISLTGAAVGTELLVRNLSLWEGVRY